MFFSPVFFYTTIKKTFVTPKVFLAKMMEDHTGTIVNISSASSLARDYSMTTYNASKAAIINMTHAMAIDYGKYGIRVSNVAPDSTNTSMFFQKMKEAFSQNSPLNRIVEPKEIAKTVYFMSTDDSRAITGETITVTAGFELSTGQQNMMI